MMNEVEYNVKAFVDVVTNKKEKDDIVFYTIVYNNKTTADVIPNYNSDMVKSISELLQNKEKIKNVSEIQIKLQKKNSIELVNKIEIS